MNRRHRASGVCGLSVMLFAALPAGAEASDAQLQCLDAFEATQEARQAGNLRRARALAQQCAPDHCLEAIRDDCRTWVAELAQEVPSVVFRVTDGEGAPVGGATIQLNGGATLSGSGRAIELDPGTHAVKVERTGYLPAETVFELRAGQRDAVVEIRLEASKEQAAAAAPQPSSTVGTRIPLWPAYVAGGVAAAGFVTLAVFGSSARSADGTLDECAPSRTCDPGRVDDIQRDYLIANIGLGVGIVGAAAGIGWSVFALTSDDEPSVNASPSASAELMIGPGSLAVTGSF